jgi:hypothetical protein
VPPTDPLTTEEEGSKWPQIILPPVPHKPGKVNRGVARILNQPHADLRLLVVEPRGLEPLTPSLQTRCATNCAKAPRAVARPANQDLWTVSVASAQRACSVLPWSIFFFARTAPAAASRTTMSFFMQAP